MKKISVFSSGNGTNAENICRYFSSSNKIKVELICTNNKNSYVLERAKKYNVSCFVFSKEEMIGGVVLEKKLIEKKIDFIVLAGFLLKLPENFIKLFNNKIVNIHPSLLPKYGGKGMYGKRVHEKVVENNEKESGITIHYVNKDYDQGGVIFQKKVELEKGECSDSLSKKIQSLEHLYFPKVIEKTILK